MRDTTERGYDKPSERLAKIGETSVTTAYDCQATVGVFVGDESGLWLKFDFTDGRFQSSSYWSEWRHVAGSDEE